MQTRTLLAQGMTGIVLVVVALVAIAAFPGEAAHATQDAAPLAAAAGLDAPGAANAPASVGVQAAKSSAKTSAKTSKKSAKAKKKKSGKWKTNGRHYFYVKPNGKRARGLYTVKNKTYLFDSSGRQLTGWQLYKGAYRYFKAANGARGRMVAGEVVNGIKLNKKGKARVTSAGREELELMVTAQHLVEQLTVPSQSKADKLQRGFDWMRYDCIERGLHDFAAFPGWHRMFAHDILDAHMGSCFSYGAAMAYYANAVGCKSCRVVSSGGHGWAEIDGAVYDVEWSRVTGFTYFNYPYSASGGGAPNYAGSRAYVIDIAPNAVMW